MKVFCILSDQRAFRSKSPAMFSWVLKRIGISAVYVPFNVNPEMIGAAMQSMRVLNIDGATITTPHKETVIPHIDILSEGANIIGAVNTVVRMGSQLKGYNTNAIGFMDTLEEQGFDVTGKTALVFGAGGAARAVVFILNWLRATNIIIAGRSPESLDKVARKIRGESALLHTLEGKPVSANILINATAVSSPDQSPELADLAGKLDLQNCELVVDLNYGYPDNFWLKLARSKGIPFIDGLAPLAHSARRTLLLWTRVDVEPQEFIQALNAIS
ncbi:MAG: hypothetical protein V1793_14145 [Pseudomonadota bacterium]